MSELPEEIGEADIPDLPDSILELYAARWLGWESEHSAVPTDHDTSRIEVSWHPPDGGEPVDDLPAYTSDAEAAWQLLVRMPSQLVTYDCGCKSWDSRRVHAYDDPERRLTEAAATLAVRGKEPREVPDG